MNRHLSTRSILYYVYGALIVLSALGALIFVGIGALIEHDAMTNMDEPPPRWLASLFKSFGYSLALGIALFGAANILVGYWIARRTSRSASMVVAALNCLSIPFGLALGVFTLITLNDESVQQEYATGRPVV